MKNKIGILMITVTLFLIVFTMSVSAITCSPVKGDLNYDGAVDNLDVEVIQYMIMGTEEPSDCADFDGDGHVTPVDLSILQNLVLTNEYNNVTYDPDFIVKRHGTSMYYYKGDTNRDGKVNYQDVGIIQKMIMGKITSHISGDIDGDGHVSPVDLSIIQTISLTPDYEPQIGYIMPDNPKCERTTGDMNRDGLVNELDKEVIQHMILGKEKSDPCGDIDGDGFVTSSDLSRIQIMAWDIEKFEIKLTPIRLDQCEKIGDINNDNKINYQDIGLIRHTVLSKLNQTRCGDLDGDGLVTSSDLSRLRTTVLTLEWLENAPVFAEIGNFTINVSETLTFDVEADDPQNDRLSYSTLNLPDGAQFVAQTFSWTPDESGNYKITFKVYDGEFTNSMDVHITVLERTVDEETNETENHAPEFVNVNDIKVNVSETITFVVDAIDEDDDRLTYTSNIPDGAQFINNVFVWQPTETGNYTASFTVSDGSLEDLMDVFIEVVGTETENNQTGNDTEDEDDQGDDNDNQGEDNNDQDQEPKVVYYYLPSKSSSRHSSTVMYMPDMKTSSPTFEEEQTETVTDIVEPEQDDKVEETVMAPVEQAPDNNVPSPSNRMMGAIIALMFGSLGMTAKHVKETLK